METISVMVIAEDIAYLGNAQKTDDGYRVTSVHGDDIFPDDIVYPEPTSLNLLNGSELYSVDMDGSSIRSIDCPQLKVEVFSVSHCRELTCFDNGPTKVDSILAQSSAIYWFDYRHGDVNIFDLSGCPIESFKGVPRIEKCIITDNVAGVLYLVGRAQQVFLRPTKSTAQEYKDYQYDASVQELPISSVFRTKLELIKQRLAWYAKF